MRNLQLNTAMKAITAETPDLPRAERRRRAKRLLAHQPVIEPPREPTHFERYELAKFLAWRNRGNQP
jgi:hypothetical protein